MSWTINHTITAPFNSTLLLMNGVLITHSINPMLEGSSLNANKVNLDTSTFDKNLDSTITDVQKLAIAVDDLVIPTQYTDAMVDARITNKVDKVNGKGLSTEDFTTAEKNKLGRINNHYRGTYTTEAALKADIPVGNAGDDALVDAGSGHNAVKYIWDEQEGWIVGSGTGASSFSELSGTPGDNAELASALAGKVNTNGTDRLMTAAEGTKLANQSGTNTGDQDLSGLQVTTQKGQANGYAGLGSDGKVPSSQLPEQSAGSGVIFWASLANNTTITAGQSINYLNILYFCKTTHAIGTPKAFDATKFDREGDDKEDKSNKRSSFQAIPDDDHYVSEKLTKDFLDAKQAQIDALAGNNQVTFSAIYAYNNFI
jgi:hypothetical protein